MQILQSEELPIRTDDDVVRARRAVRIRADALGMGSLDQTKMITAASELIRNAMKYGGGGTAEIQTVQDMGRTGLHVIIRDQGSGIPDVEQAMVDGYTTGGGLGFGLGGSRRLVHQMTVETSGDAGTCVRILRWA